MNSKSTMSAIRRHISMMEPGELVSTREFLMYGTRQNVDNALCQAVKRHLLIRVAQGVYARYKENFEHPTAEKIAAFKAKVFGKTLILHACSTDSPTFYINGESSQFQYQGQTIYLKKASNKRLHLLDDEVGKSVRMLWSLGNSGEHSELIKRIIGPYGPSTTRAPAPIVPEQ